MLALTATTAPALAQDGPPPPPARVAQPPAPPERVVKAFDHDHDAQARYARVRRWPGDRITYFDATKDSDAVRLAVKFWNRSGVDMQFKKVMSKKKAKLVIRNSRKVPHGCGTGLATLGYTGRRQAFVNILRGTDADGQACAWPGQTIVVTHELGHVLGLKHLDSTCSVMNSYHVNGVAPFRCVTPDRTDHDEMPGRWRCRGLERVDIKRVKRMYGGRIAVRDEEWCDLGVRMPATGPMTVTQTVPGQVHVALRHEPEPAQPAWLNVYPPNPGFEIHVTPGDCAAPAGTTTVSGPWAWTAAAGADEAFDQSLTAGVYCFSAVAYDSLSRPALASSPRVTVTVG